MGTHADMQGSVFLYVPWLVLQRTMYDTRDPGRAAWQIKLKVLTKKSPSPTLK